ncbi:MAG: transketolase-like TK C-terminal-containing protein, partial [Sciscionella sp.]
GLQHDDGHSLLHASTVPNMCAYDPAFAYEVALIVADGVRRMVGADAEDVLYYLTLYNENYVQPALPAGSDGDRVREGVIRGIYRFAPPAAVGAAGKGARQATLCFSGTAYVAVMEARELLARDWAVSASAWSVTSYKALREDALDTERWNRLHPGQAPRTPHVTSALADAEGPVVAVTDFMKAIPDQVARWVPGHFSSLGTDGFGRSDARATLRRYFEVDAAHVVIAVLAALVATGEAKPEEVADAIYRYGVDPEAPDPRVAL